MKCKACQQAYVQFVECRELSSGHRVWFYLCPNPLCEAEFIAKRDPATPLPVVTGLLPAKEDPTPLPGFVVQDIDLLASNPDPEGRIWWTGGHGKHVGEVAVLQRPDDEEEKRLP